MATTTENLELTLLSGTDNFDTDTIMENFTKIDTAVGEADSSIGEKDSLTTTAKDNLVAAINEVDGNIGDLSGLTTTAKTNLVSALNEVNQNMSVVDVSDKFSFSDPSKISGFHALKYGKLIRLQGLLTNVTENFIITALDNSVYPLQSPTLTDKVLNYGGWQSDDQRMVNISFSGRTITIEATSSGFNFTAVEAWYLSAY